MVMKRYITRLILALAIVLACATAYAQEKHPAQNVQTKKEAAKKEPVRKVLFIGDSMTGWLAEGLNGYGKINNFEVATIVWDGSTISKWANSPKLESIISEQDPDAVFISLGMNELFEAHPEKRFATALQKIKKAVGDRKLVWVGPPSWPGHTQGTTLNNWLAKQLGNESFFRSFDLTLPRQSAKNPHPSRQGMIQWVDSLVKWIPDNTELEFPSLNQPKKERMVRGKTFIYKRMKENL